VYLKYNIMIGANIGGLRVGDQRARALGPTSRWLRIKSEDFFLENANA